MTGAHDESWTVLAGMLPSDWRRLAFTSGAVSRLRGFADVSLLLRTLLLHVGNGYSLRETAVRAKAAGWAAVSDVALLDRLRSAGPWWRQLCARLLEENGTLLPVPAEQRRFRAVDGTVVQEPGKTGTAWRIHYSLQLPSLECDHFAITPARVKDGGESLAHLPVRPGDCLLADRGFCRTAGVLAAIHRGADIVVRLNTGNLPLYQSVGGPRFPLLESVQALREAGQCQEWNVVVGKGEAAPPLRLCALRKSEHEIARTWRSLQRQASKQGSKPKPESLEYAKYVMVVSSLPVTQFSGAQILEWYRLRWQIELAFKRLKSLASIGHLAKQDEQSARSWLYGKLLLGLLSEKLIRTGRDISPWGYSIGRPETS
jgi:hypothetical protein